jgi:hypothetical protein
MNKPSVFNSDEFQRGFIEFCASDAYRKYMAPFLDELVEAHRDKLETAEDAKSWQARLKTVRFIKDQADIQKDARAERLSASMQGADEQGDKH